MASLIFRNNSDIEAYISIDLISKTGKIKKFEDPSIAPNTISYVDNSLIEIFPDTVLYYSNG